MPEKTILELIKCGEAALAEISPTGRLDAEILLAAAAGLKRYMLLANPNQILEPADEKLYLDYIDQRKRHKPVQYILRHSEFMSLSFYVDENVLIPRGDTEVLVEKAIEIIRKKRYTKVLEVGTGSGCISVSLGKYLYNLPNLQITAVDIDESALTIAARNAAQHSVENIRFLQSDLFANAQAEYNIIISNPPYIEKDEISRLELNVKNYEPYLALDGGYDGLDFYRAICKGAPPFLCAGGAVIFEIGNKQYEQVAALLLENGFADIELTRDLAGQPRVVSAVNKGN